MTILKLPTIILIAVSCASGTHGAQEPERCFLYPANSTTFSPEYRLKTDQDNYVTINHLFNRAQTTTISNQDLACVLRLANSTSPSPGDGCLTLPYRGEYTTLGFRKRGGTIFVNVKSENEIPLNISASSLQVTSSQPVNVAFDCPGNCFQFRHALIHARPKGHENRNRLRIYGLTEDLQEANESPLALYRSENWSQQYLEYPQKWNISFSSTEWIPFDIDAVYVNSSYGDKACAYFSNVSVKTPSSETSYKLRSMLVETTDLYIDFKLTRGMRWAIHCQPHECTQATAPCDIVPAQGNFADGIKMEYFFTLVAVCGILTITTVTLCCCIIRNKGKQQQQTAQTNALSETNAADPTIIGREGNGQGAVYDYIDIQEFHKYLAKVASEKSLADSHVNSYAMGPATSHTSINSIYDCNTDMENRNTDSGRLRKFSHTSENSLYGCHP